MCIHQIPVLQGLLPVFHPGGLNPSLVVLLMLFAPTALPVFHLSILSICLFPPFPELTSKHHNPQQLYLHLQWAVLLLAAAHSFSANSRAKQLPSQFQLFNNAGVLLGFLPSFFLILVVNCMLACRLSPFSSSLSLCPKYPRPHTPIPLVLSLSFSHPL